MRTKLLDLGQFDGMGGGGPVMNYPTSGAIPEPGPAADGIYGGGPVTDPTPGPGIITDAGI